MDEVSYVFYDDPTLDEWGIRISDEELEEYYLGGIMGAKTSEAIRRFQKHANFGRAYGGGFGRP